MSKENNIHVYVSTRQVPRPLISKRGAVSAVVYCWAVWGRRGSAATTFVKTVQGRLEVACLGLLDEEAWLGRDQPVVMVKILYN